MPLISLRLEQFRPLAAAQVDLAEGINLFWGDNAQGKTSVLEAVGLLSTGRSFRTTRERDCIRWQAPEETRVAAVEGTFTVGATRHTVRLALEGNRKAVWRDGKPLRTLSELWGLLRTVLFVPADLGLVQGPPQQRRVALDALLGQCQPAHLKTLAAANRALASRNHLLRRRVPADDPQYDAFESALAPAAARTMLARARLAARLSGLAGETLQAIGAGGEALRLTYEPGFAPATGLAALVLAGAPADELAAELRACWRRARTGDLDRGVTREGPHRDDVAFELDGRDARAYASQGQARSCVLALRLAELDLLAALDPARPPVLLLDDVLGELDAGRARRFLDLVAQRRVQTLMTSTDPAGAPGPEFAVRRFRLAGGQVVEAGGEIPS
ncbi:MAG: DNA replication and repair protein RecF [Candidatus Sumerlaeia bacterium]|nr:DNA replication and repair protein RecF [Candidatus Sumerlaeia bacterium]